MKRCIALIVFSLFAATATAQYPARPIRLVVPAEAAAHIRAEMARWDRVLNAAGVQPN